MTKNKTLLLLLAMAFLLSLASCLSENIFETPPVEYGKERTVSLRLAPTATTRGESRPIGDNEPVFFRTGDLYLVTSAGIINRHFNIVACDGTPATETDVAANRINRNDLYPAGVPLPSVPGNVRYVVIVGNHSQDALPSSGMVGTVIENRFIHNHILSQYGALHPDPGVNLFGRTEIVRRTHDGTPSGTPIYSTTYPYNALFEANVILEPTVARFEIHQMTAGGTIVDFTVAGIYIDRHYRSAHINGFIPETIGGQPNLMERGTNSVAFGEGAACGYYPAGNNALFDEPGVEALLSGGYLIARPESTTLHGGVDVRNVWSYHVFAQSHNHTHRNITPPRIVIRLTGVRLYYLGETVTVPDQYLTVHGFTNTNTGIRLGNIRAGNVYRILNLAFDETNLHYRPSRPMNVEVCVQLAEWSSRPINPAGFRQPNPIGTTTDFTTVPATWHFPLGEAIHGSCSKDIVYLWQWSHTGGRYDDNAWTPFIQFTGATDAAVVAAIETARADVANARFIHQELLNLELEQTTFFRRIAMACGDFIRSEQARVGVMEPFLYVTPPTLLFTNAANGGGAQMVTVTTNMPSWTITGAPTWLNVPTGEQTGTSFNVAVVQGNTGAASRTATLTVTAASGLTRTVTVIQLGASAGGMVMPFSFVGAFWRDNQWGERLIRVNHTNAWSAFAIDDWIVLDTENSSDPYVGTENTVSMTNYDALHRLPDTAGSTVSGTGEIYFRIGLTGANPVPGTPRYGQVIVVHDNNSSAQVIWIRQGETADYLMRPDDLMPANGEPRLLARRFVPFNLTAPEGQMNSPLDIRGGVFTAYPSQAGALFHWASTIPRQAFPPVGTANNWGGYFYNTWSQIGAVQETCPEGYRRPHDDREGSTARSEIRQSLFLGITFNNSLNSVWGFYADGFFDRRPRTASQTGQINSTVAGGTNNVAYIGRLHFNATSRASIFFPAAGARTSDQFNLSNLTNAGSNASFWTTARLMQHPAAWVGSSGGSMMAESLGFGHARSVRCVVDPPSSEDEEERRANIGLSPSPFP